MPLGIHQMDMLLWLAGEWTSVQAQMTMLNREIEVDHLSVTMVTLKNRGMLTLVNSALSPREETCI